MNQSIAPSSFNQRDFRKSLGLALVFVGMQFNTALKNVISGIDISAIIMLLSVYLLLDIRNLFKIRMTRETQILTAFEFVLLIIALMSSHATIQLITFQLYLLVLTYAFSTNKEYIQFAYFGRIFFWLTGFISVVVLFQATKGFTRLSLEFANSGKLWMSEGGDPVTMSRALEMNIIACLFYREKKLVEKIATPIFVLAAVVGMFSFFNRSAIVCSILVIGILLVKEVGIKVKKRAFAICIAAVIVIVLLTTKVNYLASKVTMLYNSLISGVGTLLNIGSVAVDASAHTRVGILAEMKAEFSADFLRNLFTGLGYNYRYVDRPIYQIFFDLGLFGFVTYSYFLLFVPIRTIVKYLRNNLIYNDACVFIIFISVQCIADQFVTGLPYYYFLWTPTLFFLFSLGNYKLKKVRN